MKKSYKQILFEAFLSGVLTGVWIKAQKGGDENAVIERAVKIIIVRLPKNCFNDPQKEKE